MDFITWISQLHIVLKLSGILCIVYGVYALIRMKYLRTESEAFIPMLLGGSSLAMGLLVFILGFTKFLVGKEGL